MPKVFRSIARLVYYSNGGFTFTELYSGMPVYVRRYMTEEINNIKQKEKEQIEEGKSSSSSGQAPPEDIGKAMEQLQKQSGDEQADEDVLEEVFGDEKRESPQQQQPQPDVPKQQPTPEEESPDEPKTSDDVDPAKAEDLEQMLDKLDNQT